MSDATPAEAPTKKKGGAKKLIIIGAAIALLGGGGAAAGFYAAGSAEGKEAAKEDPDMPHLVKKGEKPEEVAKLYGGEGHAEEEEDGEGAAHHAPKKAVDLPTPRNQAAYQATYYQVPTPFTTNMADTDAFAQISIAVSTYYDQRVVDAVQTHDAAIRSAILMMLTQEQAMDLSTPEGKERLQAKLLKIINRVLKAKTGYSGVDNVYFTNFVIQ